MKSKSVSKINAIITFPTYVKIHFVCFTVTGSFWLPFICLAVWISLAESNKLPKQMNGNQKWPSYCETYEMNFHRGWKGDDDIYFGYRFWFHCLFEQNGLFLEAFFTPMAFLEYDLLTTTWRQTLDSLCQSVWVFLECLLMTGLQF